MQEPEELNPDDLLDMDDESLRGKLMVISEENTSLWARIDWGKKDDQKEWQRYRQQQARAEKWKKKALATETELSEIKAALEKESIRADENAAMVERLKSALTHVQDCLAVEHDDADFAGCVSAALSESPAEVVADEIRRMADG